jgi:hypothetical protein
MADGASFFAALRAAVRFQVPTDSSARPPERDAEASTTLQITWVGAWPRDAGHPRQRKESRPQ